MVEVYSFFIEVVEHACGMATLQMGEFVSNITNGIDTYSTREPLGVCAGICPFEFPAMIPLWVSCCFIFSIVVFLFFFFFCVIFSFWQVFFILDQIVSNAIRFI